MQFIEFPGAHERQIQRKYNHAPLFSLDQNTITADDVLVARQQDSEEVEKFMISFRQVVEKAVSLKPNEQSDVILKLKEELDQHYEQCCSLQGDMSQIKQALKTLLAAIMSAVRTGAGNDVTAQSKLDDEDKARTEHYRIQEIPFLADLTRQTNSIPAEELGLTLLTEPMNVVAEALDLFQPQQLASLVSDIHNSFSSLDDETIKPFQEKLEAISNKLTLSADPNSKN